MLKTISFLAFLLTSTVAFASSELTGKTVIEGDTVTVGDLFTNAGGNANHVLAPAPLVGQKLVLDESDLARVATAFKLDWQMPDKFTGVVLERDAVIVPLAKVTAALAASDLESRIATGAEFKLGNLADDLIVAGKTDPELKVTNTSFDADTEEFTADLTLMRGDVMLKKIAVKGLATQMISIPALKYPVSGGDVITADNLTEITIPKSQLRGGTVLAINELTGMTVRRSMVAKQGIARADIIPQVMVKRNELVTIMYNNGPVALSTKARSLGNGARGDTVMFMNTNSKKPFTAKVTGPQQAEVNVSL